MAQGPGIHLDTRHIHRRMATQGRSKLPQGIQNFLLKDSFCLQRYEQGFDAVAFGKDETIAVWILQLVFTHVQGMKIKGREHIQTGKVSARMSRMGIPDYFQKPPAASFGNQSEFMSVHYVVLFFVSRSFQMQR